MSWVQAGDYEVALEDGTVVCRNASGKLLKSVPSKLSENPVVVGLRQLVEWLDRHERTCQADVERWMVRSLAVPAPVVARVWADPAWQRVLRDLVVTTDTGATGFLRDADPERGIGMVDLDGDTVRLTPHEIRIPHPVLLDDLDDLREFAVELGVEQRIGQLYREVWHRPADLTARRTTVDDYARGRYDQLRFLYGRTTSLGYQVRGGQAVCSILEDARSIEARVWLGDFDPYDSTETGSLSWTDAAGSTLSLTSVGPVAWSEGMRMAAALYAGRSTEKQEEAA